MPDFDDNESMTETGDVAITYEVRGGGEEWLICGSDAPLTDAQGRAFLPAPISMSNVTADGSMGGGEISITMARSVTLADRFFPVATKSIYRVIVRQANHADGIIQDAPVMFTGVITSASVSGDDGELLKLKCSTQMGLLERSGLRRRYQHQCPHVLFGPACKASRPASQFPATIALPGAGVGGKGDVWLTFYGADADQPHVWRGRDLKVPANRNFMLGATISFGGADYEVIGFPSYSFQSQPNVFRVTVMPSMKQGLVDAITAAAPGDRNAIITPACEHTVSACNQIFGNGPNFGGMPWIPYENPVKTVFVGG